MHRERVAIGHLYESARSNWDLLFLSRAGNTNNEMVFNPLYFNKIPEADYAKALQQLFFLCSSKL